MDVVLTEDLVDLPPYPGSGGHPIRFPESAPGACLRRILCSSPVRSMILGKAGEPFPQHGVTPMAERERDREREREIPIRERDLRERDIPVAPNEYAYVQDL